MVVPGGSGQDWPPSGPRGPGRAGLACLLSDLLAEGPAAIAAAVRTRPWPRPLLRTAQLPSTRGPGPCAPARTRAPGPGRARTRRGRAPAPRRGRVRRRGWRGRTPGSSRWPAGARRSRRRAAAAHAEEHEAEVAERFDVAGKDLQADLQRLRRRQRPHQVGVEVAERQEGGAVRLIEGNGGLQPPDLLPVIAQVFGRTPPSAAPCPPPRCAGTPAPGRRRLRAGPGPRRPPFPAREPPRPRALPRPAGCPAPRRGRSSASRSPCRPRLRRPRRPGRRPGGAPGPWRRAPGRRRDCPGLPVRPARATPRGRRPRSAARPAAAAARCCPGYGRAPAAGRRPPGNRSPAQVGLGELEVHPVPGRIDCGRPVEGRGGLLPALQPGGDETPEENASRGGGRRRARLFQHCRRFLGAPLGRQGARQADPGIGVPRVEADRLPELLPGAAVVAVAAQGLPQPVAGVPVARVRPDQGPQPQEAPGGRSGSAAPSPTWIRGTESGADIRLPRRAAASRAGAAAGAAGGAPEPGAVRAPSGSGRSPHADSRSRETVRAASAFIGEPFSGRNGKVRESPPGR